MARIVFDRTEERFFETGVKNGVLYTKEDGAYVHGEAWNGLTAVNETPSGGEATAYYADDQKYFSLTAAEDIGATVEAYYYPDKFAECDGSAEVAPGVYISQQQRKTFGLSYRTSLGNPEKGTEYGYKLHLLYGCQASPSERAYNSISDSPDPNTLSWSISTTPENVTGFKPTALMVIDSTKVPTEKLAALEDVLYGTDAKGGGSDTEPRLPLPDEVISLLKTDATSYKSTSATVAVSTAKTNN